MTLDLLGCPDQTIADLKNTHSLFLVSEIQWRVSLVAEFINLTDIHPWDDSSPIKEPTIKIPASTDVEPRSGLSDPPSQRVGK